jgi:hypothetical protein
VLQALLLVGLLLVRKFPDAFWLADSEVVRIGLAGELVLTSGS